MKRLCVVLMLGTLCACGGSSSPTTPPTPVPVTYNGTYTGTSMTYTSGRGQLLITGSTTITQTGSNLSFGNLQTTSQSFDDAFPVGAAVLTGGNSFDSTNQYSSSGCGTITNHFRGYFSGDGGIMNMTMTLTTASNAAGCGTIDIRGEMRR
jgi:hypothetical protein